MLTIRNYNGPYAGKLNAIGGHVEEGELPVLAARREVLEETGIVLDAEYLNKNWLTTMSFPSGVELNVYFAFTLNSGRNLKLCQSWKTDEGILEWVPIEKLMNIWDPDIAGEGNICYFINYIKTLRSYSCGRV
jgi:8-oxo-dGTP pyrophosphatase MutT (NUDIX family)